MTTQPIFRYNPETGCLEEQPRMDKPLYYDEYCNCVHILWAERELTAFKEYRDSIAGLISYDTDHYKWLDKDLVEGVDFEVLRWVGDFDSGGEWDDNLQVITASPVTQPVTPDQLLWIAAFHLYSTGGFEAVKDLFIIKKS